MTATDTEVEQWLAWRRTGIGASDVAKVQAVMRGENPKNVVNREVLNTARWKERLAHYRAAV